MNTVIRLENEVTQKEKHILAKEEEILRAEMNLAVKMDLMLERQEHNHHAQSHNA
jgi:hypothetical protein